MVTASMVMADPYRNKLTIIHVVNSVFTKPMKGAPL